MDDLRQDLEYEVARLEKIVEAQAAEIERTRPVVQAAVELRHSEMWAEHVNGGSVYMFNAAVDAYERGEKT